MIRRIIEMFRVSREQDQRKFLIEEALKTEKEPTRIKLLENELNNVGFMLIVTCEQCNNYRSDLEWRGKKITKCQRCGAVKVTYPEKIPKLAIIKLVLRYAIKGY